MRVGFLASGTGANLRAALDLSQARPDLLEVVLVASDRPRCRAVAIARDEGIPVIARDFTAACGRAREATSAASRAAYAERARRFHDALDAEILRHEGVHGTIDLLVLAYGRWVHGALLRRFRNRMINQHPADLTELGVDGARALVGNNPVLDGLRRGVSRVRTSTFLVDAGRDTGGILAQGPWVPASGVEATQRAADALERRQKVLSDRPSLVCALSMIAIGALRLDATRRGPDGSPLFALDGLPLGFGGLDVDRLMRCPAGVPGILYDVRAIVESACLGAVGSGPVTAAAA